MCSLNTLFGSDGKPFCWPLALLLLLLLLLAGLVTALTGSRLTQPPVKPVLRGVRGVTPGPARTGQPSWVRSARQQREAATEGSSDCVLVASL